MDEKLIDKLETIVGEELKYNELCEKLEIPKKTGKSKIYQLEELQLYGEIIKLSKPTRFFIQEVYDKRLLQALECDKEKLQLLFDASIYKAVLDNKGEPLYLSKGDLLKITNQVNDNFGYTFNYQNMKMIGPEYTYMTEIAPIVSRILGKWCERRLKRMEKHCIILASSGFRLYKKNISDFGEYISSYNVPMQSDIEKTCQSIYDYAYYRYMPDEEENKNNKGQFVNYQRYQNFQACIKENIKDKFNGEYFDLKKVLILRFPTEEWLKNKLIETYTRLNDLEELNIEAQRKIFTTKQLNQYTGEQRQKFIDTNLSIKPPIRFKEELIRLKKEGKK